jgi:hypothetical protein
VSKYFEKMTSKLKKNIENSQNQKQIQKRIKLYTSNSAFILKHFSGTIFEPFFRNCFCFWLFSRFFSNFKHFDTNEIALKSASPAAQNMRTSGHVTIHIFSHSVDDHVPMMYCSVITYHENVTIHYNMIVLSR